jgi:ABC-type transport system involved in cytochrome c biogenesis permease subunit
MVTILIIYLVFVVLSFLNRPSDPKELRILLSIFWPVPIAIALFAFVTLYIVIIRSEPENN